MTHTTFIYETFVEAPSFKRLKREAKKLKKERRLRHAEALDMIAAKYGLQTWKALRQNELLRQADRILHMVWDQQEFDPIDMWCAKGYGLSCAGQHVYDQAMIKLTIINDLQATHNRTPQEIYEWYDSLIESDAG